MDTLSAKIILGDKKAIETLAARNPDPVEAIKATLAATKTVPAIITHMGENLAELVADPKLNIENGVFSAKNPGGWGKDDAQRIVDNVCSYFGATDSIGNTGRWILGNIACVLEDIGWDMGEFISGNELSYNTVQTSKMTFHFFREKRYAPMPFSHHKEICYARNLTDAQKHSIAAYAAPLGLSLVTVRAIIKAMQAQMEERYPDGDLGPPEEEASKIDSPATLHESIPITQEPAATQYLLVLGGALSLIDRKPTGAEMEEAESVFKVRSILKSKPDGRRVIDAEVVDGKVFTPDQPDEPGAGT